MRSGHAAYPCHGLDPSCCGCSSPAGKTAESDRSNECAGKKFLPTKPWYRTATSIDLNARIAALQFHSLSYASAFYNQRLSASRRIRQFGITRARVFEAPVVRSVRSSERQACAIGVMAAARIAAWAWACGGQFPLFNQSVTGVTDFSSVRGYHQP